MNKKTIVKGLAGSSLLFLLMNIVYSQSDTLIIRLCDDMLTKKENKTYQYIMIYKEDTLIIPKIGENIYLNPIKYYNLQFDSTNRYVKLVFENTKYIYDIGLISVFFLERGSTFCISGKKKWCRTYMGHKFWIERASIGTGLYIPRKRKK